jgi:hypothetical protein
MNTLNLLVKHFTEKVNELEERVKYLEQENIETTNALYEMENRLQAQIDALINYTMITDFPPTNDVF